MQTKSYVKTLLLLSPMILLLGFGLDLYLPSEHSIMLDLKLNIPQIQMTLSIYMYIFGLGQLFIGPIIDHCGKKIPLQLVLICFIIGCLIMYFSSNYRWLLFARGLQALGACGAMVISLSLVRQQFEGALLTKTVTYLKAIASLAPIVAPSIGVFLTIQWGWRADFIFLAFFGCIALIFSHFVYYPKSNQPNDHPHAIKVYGTIILNKNFMAYSLCAALVQMTMFAFFSISPLLYIQLFKTTETQFAMLFTINALAFMLVAFGCGRFIGKIGVNKSLQISAYLSILGGCLIISLQTFYTPNILTTALPCFIASAGAAFGLGASNTGALVPFKVNTGKAAALLGCVEFMLGGFLGSQVVNQTTITPQNLAICFVASGILILFIQYCLSRSQKSALKIDIS